MSRRTLKYINRYPTPEQIYIKLQNNSWPYKTNLDYYRLRDRALCVVLYVVALRVSEALRLTRENFTVNQSAITIEGIQLSKATKTYTKGKFKGKTVTRKQLFREYAFIRLDGERENLGKIVQEYLMLLDSKEKLFKFKRARAYQIVSTLLGVPCHWLRAFGENYLYDHWEHDILAVSDYVKIEPQTLSQYIRRSYKKYKEI